MPKVVSSNPSTVYWMDIFSHLFVVKIVMCVWKDESNEKEAGVGPLKIIVNLHLPSCYKIPTVQSIMIANFILEPDSTFFYSVYIVHY